MAFEGLICPACSNPLDESKLEENMVCPSCSTKLKQKKFLAFLEFLMTHGLVTNIDFFDQTLYGDEIKKCKWKVFTGSCNQITGSESDNPFWDRFVRETSDHPDSQSGCATGPGHRKM